MNSDLENIGYSFGDTFIEEVVKVPAKTSDSVLKIGSLIITILLFFIALLGILPKLTWIIAIAFAVITYILMGRKNIEYEYDYTNGSLEISRITNNEKRKKIVSIEHDKIKLIATEDVNEYLKFDNVSMKKIDCSSSNSEEKKCVLVAFSEKNKGDIKLYFNPSVELLTAMKKYNRNELYMK